MVWILVLVAHNRSEFLVVVNIVVEFGLSKMREIVWLAVRLSACSVGHSFFSFSFRAL